MSESYKKYLSKNSVFFLNVKTKTELLDAMASRVVAEDSSLDKSELVTKLEEREELMSTGMGLGIGVPHLRYSAIKNPRVLVGICRSGIQDYESMDGQPVKIVAMILVGESQHQEYLKILSELMKKLKQDDVRKKILSASSPEEVYNILIG
ncbi:PTS sugar transporter subunit IIA [Spirochaetia bacterium 38H-sp]|uniref:PTS sugar transporter subunit IIA n=1 Tax=Rarispira pelagica TaxID=3141764 RepID=A0ABU9U8Y8_9SPIR